MYYLIVWSNERTGKAHAEVFTTKKARNQYNKDCMAQAEPVYKVMETLNAEEFTQAIWNGTYKDPQFH